MKFSYKMSNLPDAFIVNIAKTKGLLIGTLKEVGSYVNNKGIMVRSTTLITSENACCENVEQATAVDFAQKIFAL